MRRKLCLFVSVTVIASLSLIFERSLPASCPLTLTITSSPFALVAADGPKVATLSARVQNSGSTVLKNVTVFLGNGTTPGTFDDAGGQSLQMLGPTSEATRFVGNLPPGATRTVYWHVLYPSTTDISYPYTVGRLPKTRVARRRARPSRRKALQRQVRAESCPPTAQ
uniref:CARDB domain-containing protein n=1 Tax=Acetithermum autotrophicum TaxID=1446466 RepID=H5SSJ2_ACEAU|nr:hypothetical protein HGMM_OP3C283 [Candidatus Acetothermum autotrophicum]